MRKRRRTVPLMTADELLALADDDMHRYELDAGHLSVREPAGYRHGQIVSRIFSALIEYSRQTRTGEVVSFDTGFLLGENPDVVRAPDIAFLLTPRTRDEDGYVLGAPDLAVEVRSPSERPSILTGKLRDYFAAGTQVVWVVDPTNRTVVVHVRDGSVRTLREGEMLDGGLILSGFKVEVDALFTEW